MESRINTFRVVCFLALSLVFLLALAIRPSGKFVVVIMNPSAPAASVIDTIAEAGGAFVAGGRYPWMAIAHSDADGFATRLLHAGAILVLNNWAATGCKERTQP